MQRALCFRKGKGASAVGHRRGWLELEARRQLRIARQVGLIADLSEVRAAEGLPNSTKLRVVGDVIQIRLKTQPGGFSEVKCEAATKADVEIVVAWTIDVVGSGARRVAKDKIWGGDE